MAVRDWRARASAQEKGHAKSRYDCPISFHQINRQRHIARICYGRRTRESLSRAGVGFHNAKSEEGPPFTTAAVGRKEIHLRGRQWAKVADMFPCSFAGTFSAMLAWTIVDIPMDMSSPGLGSIEDVQNVLRPELAALCQSAPEGLPEDCLADLEWQVASWIRWQCGAGPSSRRHTWRSRGGSGTREEGSSTPHHQLKREKASLDAFKHEVASELGLGQAWTLADVDAAFGLADTAAAATAAQSTPAEGPAEGLGPGGEPRGLCGAASAPGPAELGKVLVVGSFGQSLVCGGDRSRDVVGLACPAADKRLQPDHARRYRDYLFRDLLGGIVARSAARPPLGLVSSLGALLQAPTPRSHGAPLSNLRPAEQPPRHLP